MKNKEIEFLIEQIEMDLNEGRSIHAPASYTEEDRMKARKNKKYNIQSRKPSENYHLDSNLPVIIIDLYEKYEKGELLSPAEFAKFILNEMERDADVERLPSADSIMKTCRAYISGELQNDMTTAASWNHTQYNKYVDKKGFIIKRKRFLSYMRKLVIDPAFVKTLKSLLRKRLFKPSNLMAHLTADKAGKFRNRLENV